jgi:hypothetical protein
MFHRILTILHIFVIPDGLKPDAVVEKPTIAPLCDNSYKLSWVIPREPRSPQDYTLEIREPPSFRWQMVTTGIQDTDYILENVKPEKDYMYRIIVENDYGESDPSPAVSLRQGPGQLNQNIPFPFESGYNTQKYVLLRCSELFKCTTVTFSLAIWRMNNFNLVQSVMHFPLNLAPSSAAHNLLRQI